jgi:hypothetical protein
MELSGLASCQHLDVIFQKIGETQPLSQDIGVSMYQLFKHLPLMFV